ncbi:hypothetical protein [uncultured Ruegeria sp.]|uniref:hypothetical protein n=1 Tax=uncultured Ruegeria sp. TaxID=259304 RepID=UPI0026377078|nr:hypothetical protein [uncultured Ruegeria sp.]
MSVFEDPLHKALYTALNATDTAKNAVFDITSGSDCPEMLHAVAERFFESEDSELIALNVIEDVGLLMRMLHDAAAAETQSGYVADEHCMSGGGYEVTHLSDLGQQFETARASVAALYSALYEVNLHLRAERLSVSLRA